MRKTFRNILTAILLCCGAVPSAAQEFRCDVEVNADQVEGTIKSTFGTLQEAINSYMNETKFSDATF